MSIRRRISENTEQRGDKMLPYLSEVQNTSKKYSVAFRGLNYGEGTQDGEFAETYNLSTDQHPCITQRAARIEAGEYRKPTTIHSKGKLLVIDDRLDENGEPTGFADVYYGDNPDPIGEVTSGKKQTATIGNYIVIFPDKKYYKVPTDDEDGEFGNMEETYIASGFSFKSSTITMASADFASQFKVGDVVSISGCTLDTNNKEGLIVSGATTDEITFSDNTFTKATESGEVTINGNGYREYKITSFNFEGDYIITSTEDVDFTSQFKKGDVVSISGSTNSANNKEGLIIQNVFPNSIFFKGTSLFVKGGNYSEVTIKGNVNREYIASNLSFGASTITLAKFPFREGDAVTITGCSKVENNKEAEILVRGVTSNELTFDDNAFTETTESGKVTIKRTVPDLDFICESNYRLWGTHGNTIYSSKFSDPLNFQVFDNLASDSYAIEVGSEGEFTGCIPYSSHICFFKENTLHKLYGTKPSNFQITTVNVYGVQSGSERSMQIVNEQLLYKGVGGIYAYTGGVPELISEKFGTKRYSEAVACCDGEKYYLSMKQGDTWNMFVYDVLKNIWLREDDTQAVDMTFYDGKVYYLDAKGGLYYIDKTADRSDIEWGATFCTMHETMNERKGYSKFHLRMDLSAGAWLAVDIKTDNDLQWQQIYTTHNEKAKTVSIPIIPTRCDSIDIRLRGKGKCTIKAFIREFSVGSDV